MTDHARRKTLLQTSQFKHQCPGLRLRSSHLVSQWPWSRSRRWGFSILRDTEGGEHLVPGAIFQVHTTLLVPLERWGNALYRCLVCGWSAFRISTKLRLGTNHPVHACMHALGIVRAPFAKAFYSQKPSDGEEQREIWVTLSELTTSEHSWDKAIVFWKHQRPTVALDSKDSTVIFLGRSDHCTYVMWSSSEVDSCPVTQTVEPFRILADLSSHQPVLAWS